MDLKKIECFIMLFSLINLCSAAAADLGYFLDREVRIFSSSANHIFLVHDLGTDNLAHKSKFSSLQNLYSAFKIMKDSTEYRIKSGNKFVGAEKDQLIFIDRSYLWKIKKVKFGWTISENNRCWTMQDQDTVILSKCTDTEDQIFDFKLADEDSKCDKEKSDKHHVIIELANTPDKKDKEAKRPILKNVLDPKPEEDCENPDDNNPDDDKNRDDKMLSDDENNEKEDNSASTENSTEGNKVKILPIIKKHNSIDFESNPEIRSI